MIATKAVYGLASDPLYLERWLSFGDDGIIRIWDERNTSGPVFNIATEYRIHQITWCPTKSNLIACIVILIFISRAKIQQ